MAKKNKKKKKQRAYSTTFFNLLAPSEGHTLDENGFIKLTPFPETERKIYGPKKRDPELVDLFYKTLYDRLDGRRIPKADEGVKDPDKNISDEALAEYYAKNHIGEYVHLETISRGDRTQTTNRIKFEFGSMFSGYQKINLDDNGENEVIRKLSYAETSKKSFINKLNNTLRYINYFIEYFDDDDELMGTYFYLMFQIMNRDIELEPEEFIENLYAYFSTDSIKKKIVKMVEYNTDETLIKKTDRVYDESIQLTVDHLKAIMAVSCIHKFIIPIVSHYYCMKQRLLEKIGMTDKDLYYYAFASFIPVFDEYYDISLYDKLYHTATTRVKKTTNQESKMWERRHRFGTTPTSFTNTLMKDFLIDISQKAVFSKSAIIFIHVCFDNSIKNELIQADKYEFTEMKMDASDSVNETISRWDRWQMDKAFHSQKDRIRAYVSIKDGLDYLGRQVGIDFKRMRSKDPRDIERTKALREEFDFYRENIPQPMNEAQIYIISQYYTKMIGGGDDDKMLEPKDIIKLIMIMKRDFSARNYNFLRFFISSQVLPTADHRANKRRVQKLFENDPLYEDWVSQYPDLKALNLDRQYNECKTPVFCPIRVVDYDYNELNGKTVTPYDVSVTNELIRFFM